MEEDGSGDDAGVAAAMLQEQAAMLQLLEQRMQDQFGLAFPSGSSEGQAGHTAEGMRGTNYLLLSI